MAESFFLEGPFYAGKTSLLLRLIAPYRSAIGGFVTQRLTENGDKQAFCLTPASEADRPSLPLSPEQEERIFIREENGRYHKDLRVFETLGTALLRDTKGKKLFLLDEIGGMELLCEPFRETLFCLLKGGVLCIGVLKSDQNTDNLRAHVALDRSLESYRAQLYRTIRDQGGEIWRLTEENRVQAEACLRAFLHKYCGSPAR